MILKIEQEKHSTGKIIRPQPHATKYQNPKSQNHKKQNPHSHIKYHDKSIDFLLHGCGR